ncbi:type II toxin-antitoxin system HipA family toxin YjjJ [Janthinobacterium aquaticum]|uniref:type II toxin-antitoxin system HipA family toxin YjjJ n=1 Tax=Janthinobacterium sp. FT58W TaxID=2654254 RepID=UPI001263EC0B|nr:type II toxin-antitoxin system HipA family toxin YjjJ [Janthinobacterium sp. FT58W]KAB8042043.1 type II toxin-antitoxin system HipA family toxin YjjJ [Janthinobacterium sp. FT58W]
MTRNEQLEELLRLLAGGPVGMAQLTKSLGISQPTFSRLWACVEQGVTLGAGRTRRYALSRSVAGVATPVPVFQIDGMGRITPAGQLDALAGGFYTLEQAERNSPRLFQGLPFFIKDLRPQGFLGRMEPGKYPELELPADISRWTDAHALKYIACRSEQAAGNLILGNESYARYLADQATLAQSLLPEDQRAQRYVHMAQDAMQGEAPGSSAGGEQPKFTAVLQRSGPAERIEHVLVKFSPPLDSAGGQRWADLLLCEHLALNVLARENIAVAQTDIVQGGGRLFLEVVRFDRIGMNGRQPMVTLSALDGDLGMLDQNWTAVAHELARQKLLPAHDVATIEVLDLYGALIGNTDRHHGNLALSWAFDQPYRLLPAYDMLPMLYRPNSHGEVIARQWQANLGAGLALRHLPRCLSMAMQFWRDVLDDARISAAFRNDVAQPHLASLQALQPAL